MNLAYIPSPGFSKFSIGPVTIHMYAICILTGIIFAVWILTVRWKKNGGTFDQVLDTTLVAVPCGLVGARLYHCITTPDIYFPPTATSSTSSRCGKAAWPSSAASGGGLGRVPVVPPPALSVRPAGRLHRAGADGSAGHRTTGQLVQPGTVRHADHAAMGLKLNDADAIGKSEICYNGQACPTGTLFHPTFLYEMIWNLIGAAIIVWLGHKLVDVLKSGQQFAMYMMWYGLGRTWIESIRINYSTIILGLRVNVWTAIIVFLAGCILFVVLWRFGSETRDLTSRLRAVTADEMERQRQLEERAAAKSGKTAKTAKPETPAETAESEIHQD